MRHRLLLPLMCCFIGFAQNADAVTINKSQASGNVRTDSGGGICASVSHLQAPAMPLSKLSEAVVYLDKQPTTQNGILGREARVFPTINFIGGEVANSVGDFTGPNSPDIILPFTNHPMAAPIGDGRFIATRVRGYLNVTTTLAKSPVTFALNCDDACSLKIGQTQVIELADERTSQRVTKQVTFDDAGMYAVEILYYQNAASAYLEWSRANSAEPEGDMYKNPLDITKYKLLQESELFSSIVGQNPSCKECGGELDPCPNATYCGDGLCQACNVPDHCGDSCVKCPDNRRLCSNGTCVQCTADAMCPAGLSCKDGTCVPPTACSKDEDCRALGKICDPDHFICVDTPIPCASDSVCPAGQICLPNSSGAKVCQVPPTSCTDDSKCAMNQYCDTAAGICKARNSLLYYGANGSPLGCSVTPGSRQGGTGLGMFALIALALGGLFVSRRRAVSAGGARTYTGAHARTVLSRAAWLLPVFFCAVTTEAQAQSGPISINTQTFRPALGPENIFTVEGSRTPGRWRPMANVLFEYAHVPLRLYDRQKMQDVVDTVPGAFTVHLMGGIGLTRWLSIGVDLPIVAWQGFNRQGTPLSDVPTEPSSAGIGDLRLIAKFRIIDNTDGGFGLAFVPQITFPTGDGTQFRGDDAFGFEPRLALDYRTKGGFIVALNASVLLRTSDQSARNVLVSHQVRYGLGAFLPLPKNFGLAAEIIGATSFFNAENIYTPLELYAGGRWIHHSGINVNLGAGPGLTPVAGSPQFRVFASVGYLPMERKREPVKPKVVDLDPDHDGLIGVNDRCPNVYGPPENQGCPDIDTDKDGLVDRLDRCPTQPGPKENQGCPDTDRDGDGLVDRLDSCPDQPGPLENNGCPLMDTDKDGIPDKDDKCPYVPGPKETNGCPPPQKYINVTAEKIELLQKILFATNKADIKPASFDLLNEVVSVMKSRPTMQVHIEGHTDSRGTLQYNMDLSRRRAESVKKYLLDHGIEGERLTSEGYGPTRPLCPQKNNTCYDKNRRTEFVIVKQ